MNLKRWVNRDDLKDELRGILVTPTMTAALEVVEQFGKPVVNIKGQADDHLHNLALAHAFQSGIHFALDKLRELPSITLTKKDDVERSWDRFSRSEEDDKSEEETQPQ